MNITLDKEDLINLVKGCNPNYNVMNNQLISQCGSYWGSYGRWDWNTHQLEQCTEEKLIEIYCICKNSWK